jgi:hypothetical protein
MGKFIKPLSAAQALVYEGVWFGGLVTRWFRIFVLFSFPPFPTGPHRGVSYV